MAIHPTAIVDQLAEVDLSADIGPYAVVEGHVRVGRDVRVGPHAYLTGWTEIGAGCEVHKGAVVGHVPQDLSWQGGESYCRIGEKSIIREGATVHRGSAPGSSTVVGGSCYIMAGAHVAHNCRVGDEVKLANGALLAGHVSVGDKAFVSGNSVVHQFVRIGELVMIGGLARVHMDVPPYFLVGGSGVCAGINVVGLRRSDFSSEERRDVKLAYRLLYRSGLSFDEAVARLASESSTRAIDSMLEFLRAPSRRGILSARERRREHFPQATGED